jgi:GntR family transcriptional repressor for pyruvate dehydrogenase complex
MPPSAPSRTQEISNVLRDDILRGQYRPGERLPSERDLVSRFETSRGTVREAFKTLEQLGIVSIQPGGARVVPVEDCTLDILGPLLDLGEVPDPQLIDHALEIGSVLVGFAVVKAMGNGSDATVTQARAIVREMLDAEDENIQAVMGTPRLIRLFAESSGHLVLRLIMNGLRSQVVERLHAIGFPPRHDPQALRRIAEKLDRALESHDADRIAHVMRELLSLIRSSVQRSLGHMEPRHEVAVT